MTTPTYTPSDLAPLFDALKSLEVDYPQQPARRAWWLTKIAAQQAEVDAKPNTEFGSRAWFAGIEEEEI